MKPALLILAWFVLSLSSVLATAQIGEVLELDGERVMIYSTPLESYWTEDNPRPDLPMSSTACWRGYVGLWKIENNKLFLVSLHKESWEGESPLGEEIPLADIFEDKKSPVLAHWFSGVIRIPEGEQLRYVHMGFGSIYERERFISIQEGVVTGTSVKDNKGIGATRSTADMQWVSIAAEPIEPGEGWVDARDLLVDPWREKVATGEKVTTRGIYFQFDEDETPMISVPETPKTGGFSIPLATMPKDAKVANGSHVEFEGTYSLELDGFQVTKIRELKPGETMHRPEFKVQEPEADPEGEAEAEEE